MKLWLFVMTSLILFYSGSLPKDSEGAFEYKVSRLNQAMKIDGDWEKPQWKNVKPIEINHFMGPVPAFKPIAHAKILYDDQNLYIIFQVKDRYVRSLVTKHQGRVYEDACVEFFFSPDAASPLNYFNIETNCGGAILMGYNSAAPRKSSEVPIEDINKIELFHSLPSVVDPEIDGPVTWTIEYRVPLSVLEKFASVTKPAQGVSWRANFYKIAEKGSNIHFKTWAPIENEKPNFHLPQFFGTLKFQ